MADGGPAPLAERTWPELTGVAQDRLLVVPLGSTEQHGPHLPLATDTLIAVALAEGLAAVRPAAVVAPAIPYGSSGEHAGFPGTLSLGQAALEQVLVELVRSADHFGGVVLVCAHGGNAAPLQRAVATLQGEGRRILAWAPRPAGGDAHAGRTETSILLALAPHLVHTEAAAPGATAPIADLLPALRVGGVRSVSANGVLGDPTGASAAEGQALLATLTDDLVRTVDGWSGR